MIHIRFAEPGHLVEIRELLMKSNLPYSDIPESMIEFIVALSDDRVVGCIGIERYGTDALLRSFAVSPELQHQGIGKMLINELFVYSVKSKVSALHLLTNTAKDYFAKYHFLVSERSKAPGTISRTSEFAGLCPVTSTYMVLHNISTYAS